MLEKDMETAIDTCPDLFIEPGLALVRRQVVINGRRPDILFEDRLARRLLVEVQSGRLDEDHVQRHFYYFFDYRAKYPSNHLRLLFIANRIVPQHKEFLDEHGYEFREIPDSDFARRVGECRSRATPLDLGVEVVTTPGVLSPSTYDILYDIERERMTLSYKMLLLLFLAEGADASGRVSLRTMAERFQSFSWIALSEAKRKRTRMSSSQMCCLVAICVDGSEQLSTSPCITSVRNWSLESGNI